MDKDLLNRYKEWKTKTSDPEHKGRKHTLDQHNHWSWAATQKSQECITPYGEFDSRSAFDTYAKKQLDLKLFSLNEKKIVSFSAKSSALPHLYYYKSEGPGKPTSETVYYCPVLNHKTLALIMRKADEINFRGINNYKDKLTWWYKMCKLYPKEFFTKEEESIEWDLVEISIKTKEVWTKEKEYEQNKLNDEINKENKKEYQQTEEYKLKKEKSLENRSNNLEWKKKLSKSARERRGRTVITEIGTFPSRADFTDAWKEKFGKLPGDKFRYLPHLYYNEDTGPGEVSTETVFHSPFGKAGGRGRTKIFKLAEKSGKTDISNYKDKGSWWYKMCKLYPKEYYITVEPKRDWDLWYLDND